MKSNTNIHHLPYKLSLLAISLFIMMSAVISPALPLMMHAFPTISHVNIELLATIPNLGMIFGLLISPFLNRKWSPNRLEQRLHQFVFPLCLAFNAGGFFLISTAHHFWILVTGCIILESGFGLVMPFVFKWIDNVSDKNAVNFSTTIVLITMDIGCAISPLTIALIDRTARGALFSSAIFFTLLTIYGLFKSLKHTFIK